MNISKRRVCDVWNQESMKKPSAIWLPLLLTLDQNRERTNISNTPLTLFRRNKSEFWSRIITVDETYIYYYTTKSKIQSKQWTYKGETATKKAKTTVFVEIYKSIIFKKEKPL